MSEIIGNHVTYDGPEGEVGAYLARPIGEGPFPAILVVHEIFGLTEWVTRAADRLAGAGYVCLAPDLYSRDEYRKSITIDDIEEGLGVMHSGDPEAALAGRDDATIEKIQATISWIQGCFTAPAFVPELAAGIGRLRARADISSVGVIGWCMGGGLVGRLLATGAELDAGVIWYGPPPPTDQVGNISCAVQGHYGSNDRLTQSVPALEEAFAASGGDFEAFVYDGADHAFGNDTRASHHPEAAEQAWERSIAFFGTHLS